MRVEHGAPPIPPQRGDGLPEDSRRPSRGGTSLSRPPDTVQISSEARNLHAGRAPRVPDSDRQMSGPEGVRLEDIRHRIDAGYYDSWDVQKAVAEELMTLFGV